MWRLEQLSPFGSIVRADVPETDLSVLSVSFVKELIDEHRVVTFRGFAPLEGNSFPEFCKKFGELLEWDFGSVNDLVVHEQPRNYLYTNRAVPFHWDGAFVNQAPHYIIFHCDLAPADGCGGETLFCDTTRLLDHAASEQRELWKQIVITYSTEKIVHYGGTFTSPLITQHPLKQIPVVRYAEPVLDLNPVSLEIEGVAQKDQPEFIRDMNRRLRETHSCYSHQWIAGDVVIADNYTLLHGRQAFSPGCLRHIRRVNVL